MHEVSIVLNFCYTYSSLKNHRALNEVNDLYMRIRDGFRAIERRSSLRGIFVYSSLHLHFTGIAQSNRI